ncbi:unnamed protein product [Blepharisma stoltei]|uniref:Uncharacterized protein n=1 Tax=Blepharisma stoltei TaxID=1481888 RepID=A0AAU9JZV4_9CILI|nr:unnamed protein product [Blepharisma stoltei]
MSTREKKPESSAIQDFLRRVFLNYSVSGTRYSMNYLRLPKYIQLCEDAHLLGQDLKSRDIEVLFHSLNKRNPNMTFKAFLETFTKLSELKFPDLFRRNPGEAFSKLIMAHFLPLAEELQAKRELVTDDMLEVSEDCKMILHNVNKGLKQLYLDTFSWETENETYDNIMNKSQNALEILLRELDIYPALISKAKIYSFWRDIVIMQDATFQPAVELLPQGTQDIGKVLTLSKFILIIYLCSIFGYQESQVSPNSNSEKLLILLERMELTRNSAIASKNSLLPSTDVMQIIMQKEQAEIQPSQLENQSVDENADYGLDQEGEEIVEKYAYRIQRIFQVYCAYGDALNTSSMKSSNLLKLLKDCGLLSETQVSESFDISVCRKGKEVPIITAVEIDLIFSKLTGINKVNKNQKLARKIDFQQFLKALEIIARKVYPTQPIQEAYRLLLEEYILKLEEELNESRIVCSENIKEALESLKNDDIIEALSIVHRSILYFYRYYTDNQNLMSYNNFIAFCRDFELFPDLVSKTKLVRFFYTLAGMANENEPGVSLDASLSRTSIQEKLSKTSTETIDEHLFVEALALISAEVKYEDPNLNPIEKLCFLMERMSQSTGPVKILREQGHNRSSHGEIHDLLALLKVRYPQILDHTQKKELNFEDLASLISI